MESLFIIGFAWLTILVTGVGLLVTRVFRVDVVIERFCGGLQTLQARPVRVWMALAVAVGVLFSLLLTWVTGHLLGLNDLGEDEMLLYATVCQIVLGYGMFLIVLIWIHRRSEGGLGALFGRVQEQSVSVCFSRGLRYYLMAMPGIVLMGFLYFKLLEILGIPLEPQPIMEMLSGLDSPIWIIGMGIFAVVLAPVVEELAFRGLLLPLLTRRAGLVAGIIICSLLFALLHGHLQTLFPLMVVAVFFSFGYVFGQSIWVPIVMHGCFNGMNLVTMYLQQGLN